MMNEELSLTLCQSPRHRLGSHRCTTGGEFENKTLTVRTSLTMLRAMRVYAPVYYPVDRTSHCPPLPPPERRSWILVAARELSPLTLSTPGRLEGRSQARGGGSRRRSNAYRIYAYIPGHQPTDRHRRGVCVFSSSLIRRR